MAGSLFSEFTNLYSLSKTLRFELKPLPQTKGLEEVIVQDKKIKLLYEREMKPLFDTLHFDFISEALKNKKLPEEILSSLEIQYIQLKKNKEKNIESKLSTELQHLRNIIVDYLNEYGNIKKKEWANQGIQIKSNGVEVLTDEKILDVLSTFLNPQKKDVIIKFKGFFTYFSGYNQNRNNYYSNEDKNTAVGNRIINENLLRYMDNRILFSEILLHIPELKEYEKKLTLSSYSQYLAQDEIEKFNQDVVGKINSHINQFVQHNPLVFKRLPKLKLLYKQIGSPKSESKIFFISKGEEWENLKNLIEDQNKIIKLDLKEYGIFDQLKDTYRNFFSSLETYELEHIYLNKKAINTISSMWFTGGWSTILQILVDKRIINKNKEGEAIIPDEISLIELQTALNSFENQNPKDVELFKDRYKEQYKESLWMTFISIWKYEISSKFDALRNHFNTFNSNKKIPFKKDLHKEIVKNICDTYRDIEQMTKYFSVKESVTTDTTFYQVINEYLKNSSLRKYYDAFRNLISKKPVNEEKIKLNFYNSTLLDGWDVNKESSNLCVLIKNDKDQYYLAVMCKKNNFSFDRKKNKDLYSDNPITRYKKLDYKLLPGPNKMLPKIFFSKKNEKLFDIPDEIKRIREVESFKKGKQFNKKDLSTWVNFCKENINKYPNWSVFNFSFTDTEKYQDVSQFYKEVEEQGYKISWESINEEMLNKLVNEGKIYLFQIFNKDFALDESLLKDSKWKKSQPSKGKQNLHTYLFQELLKPENVNKLKLLGGSEIFYREPSTEKVMKKVNKREVLDSKRYYEQKFFLHFPIEIKSSKRNIPFNQKVLQALYSKKDQVNIIGIDRGEKHLLYYSVIQPDGTILEQGSLNKITVDHPVKEKIFEIEELDDHGFPKRISELTPTGKKVNYIDYHTILTYYEAKRNIARRSWETIGAIKNFKEGYLSQVVHVIYKLMIKHNAIVVLEDLNTEFKAKRGAKVEKSVYEKFEIALARKLNHLILKETPSSQPGSILNPYQLTPEINAETLSRFKVSKHWGFLFYVRANYTSTTDPVSGWRKHIHIPTGTTINTIKDFFTGNKFTENGIKIILDQSKNCYVFEYQFMGQLWKLYALNTLERFKFNNKKRKAEPIDIHSGLEKLFKNFDKSKDLIQQAVNNSHFDWKALVFHWNLLNQIRNTNRSKEGNENDFILSPVQPFFDSRKIDTKILPENGDANGAYNIARKGAIILNRINIAGKNDQTFEYKQKKPPIDFLVKDIDWDNYTYQESNI